MTRPSSPRAAWRRAHQDARIRARAAVTRGMPWHGATRAGDTLVSLTASSIGDHAGHVTAARQPDHARARLFACLEAAAVARAGGWGRIAVRHWLTQARTLRLTRAGGRTLGRAA